MSQSLGFILTIFLCFYLQNVQCRSVIRDHEIEPAKNIQPVHGEARIFPPALLAAKKLLLLKFKKLLPIKLVLLRSDGASADLIEAYPTSILPDDLEFISTPNGIAGHSEIQAIAIPSSITKTQEPEELLPVNDNNEDNNKTPTPVQKGRHNQHHIKTSSAYRTLLKNVPIALYSVEDGKINRRNGHNQNNAGSHYQY